MFGCQMARRFNSQHTRDGCSTGYRPYWDTPKNNIGRKPPGASGLGFVTRARSCPQGSGYIQLLAGKQSQHAPFFCINNLSSITLRNFPLHSSAQRHCAILSASSVFSHLGSKPNFLHLFLQLQPNTREQTWKLVQEAGIRTALPLLQRHPQRSRQ
jgi:hypothetical protein